jgi:hypothetical protein
MQFCYYHAHQCTDFFTITCTSLKSMLHICGSRKKRFFSINEIILRNTIYYSLGQRSIDFWEVTILVIGTISVPWTRGWVSPGFTLLSQGTLTGCVHMTIMLYYRRLASDSLLDDHLYDVCSLNGYWWTSILKIYWLNMSEQTDS